MTTKTYQLDTLTCPSCSAKIEGVLKRTEGVEKYEVLFNSSRVRVSFDDAIIESDDIKDIIGSLGFRVLKEK